MRTDRSVVFNMHKRIRAPRPRSNRSDYHHVNSDDGCTLERSSNCHASSLTTLLDRPPDSPESSLLSVFPGNDRHDVRRRTMFAFAAAALLLWSPAAAMDVAASSSISDHPIHRCRTTSLESKTLAFVLSHPNTSSRTHLPNSRHSMSISRKTPNHRSSAPNIDTWSNAVRHKTILQRVP